MDALDRFGKWVQLKVYQIEVTFSVYMFTPAEKFIFCTSSRLLQVGRKMVPTQEGGKRT
jgi:hypothetical protein